MVRSWIIQLLNVFRILFIMLLMISMFSISILRYLDILDPNQIELSEMLSETETEREAENEKEKETEETDIDEYIKGHLRSGVLDPHKLLGFGAQTCCLLNSHRDISTPPPELARLA